MPGAPLPLDNFDVQYSWRESHHGAVPPNLTVVIRSQLLSSTGQTFWDWSGSLLHDGTFYLSFDGLTDLQQQAIRMGEPFTYTIGSDRYAIRQHASVRISGIISGAISGDVEVDPVITVAPGLEPYYSIVYDEGVFAPEPGPTALAATALLVLRVVSGLRRGRRGAC